jgi:hypothetical protein
MGAEGQPRQPWDIPPGSGAEPAPDPRLIPNPPVSPEVSERVSAILDAAEREVSEIRRQAREEAMRYTDYARRRADGLVAERQMRIAELSGELLERAERLLRQVESAEPLREALDDLVRKLTETAEGLTHEAGNLGEFVPPDFAEAAAEKPDPAPEPGPHPVPDPAPPPRPAPPPPAPDPPQAPPPAAAAPQPSPAPSRGPTWPQAVQPSVSTPRPPEAAPEPTGPATERRAPRPPNANAATMVAIQMAASGATRAQVEVHIRDELGISEPASILDEVFGLGSDPDATVSWARPG